MVESRAVGTEAKTFDIDPFRTQFFRDLGRYTLALLVRDGQLTPELEKVAREKGYERIIKEARTDPSGTVTLYKGELGVAIDQLAQADPEGVSSGRYPYLKPAVSPNGASLDVQADIGVLDIMPNAVEDDPVHVSFEKARAARETWAEERNSLIRP